MNSRTVSWNNRWSNLKLKISKNNGHMTMDMLYELMDLLKIIRDLGHKGVDNIIKPTKPTGPPNVTDPNKPIEVPNPDPEPESEPGDANFQSLTAEEIRDLLSTLSGDERLDAKYIKNLSENIFVNMSGSEVPLHTFLKFLFDQLNKEISFDKLTYEELIDLLGYIPLAPDNIVQNLDDPKTDTIISTEGLNVLLDELKTEYIKFHFNDESEVNIPHTFIDILEPEIWVNNRKIQTYYESTTNNLLVKFSENVSGYVIIKNLKE